MNGVYSVMKFTYPAVFKKTEQGSFEGYFPDLAMCRVTGDSLDDAIRNAIEAEREWISLELEEEEAELPAITDPEDIDAAQDEIVRSIGVNIRFFEGWDE